MAPIEVIYEHGVLRPLRPLDLAEGTRLAVTITAIAPPLTEQEEAGVDEAAYLAFLSELDRIAALPPKGTPNLMPRGTMMPSCTQGTERCRDLC